MILPGPVWPISAGAAAAAGLTYIEYRGGTARGSTNTTILRFLTEVARVGTGATVTDSAANGWNVNIVTPGIWLVGSILRFGSSAAMGLRKNTALNNTFDLSTETDLYAYGNANTAHSLAVPGLLCAAGDKIWVCSNVAPSNLPNHNRIVITGPYPVA